MRDKAAKVWLADWEPALDSTRRETWWINPLNNRFQSIVNGHVIRESSWHYWSVGDAGWVSAETFMLIDGCFVRSAIAWEDWLAGTSFETANPYDVSHVRIFDMARLDRQVSRNWFFDDPDVTPWAFACRGARDFAESKGYTAVRLTGHHVGERVGAICIPGRGIQVDDIPLADVTKTGWAFDDINTVSWAQAGRAAMSIAGNRGLVGGFFTGHQAFDENNRPSSFGWIGLSSEIATRRDVADSEIVGSPWMFADVNEVDWAMAARLATEVASRDGVTAAFLTGHQLKDVGKRQIVEFL